MALKDINVFEKHAEKMVVGAAAAGALFMGYMAVQPITVESNGQEVSPGEVQDVIRTAIGEPVPPGQEPQAKRGSPSFTLEDSRREIENLGRPQVIVPNYVDRYDAVARQQPLDQGILAARVPQFAPANYVPSRIEEDRPLEETVVVAPDPVPPKGLTATAVQYAVADDQQQASQASLGAGLLLPSHDQRAVVVEGYIPVGEMMKQMVSVKDAKSRVPNDRQRVVVQNLIVERSELLPMGGQTGWARVPGTKAIQVPPQIIDWTKEEDVFGGLDIAERQFKEAVIPDFYYDQTGVLIKAPILSRPIPEDIVREMTDLEAVIQAGRQGAVIGRGGPGTPAPSASGAKNEWPADAVGLKTMQIIPFAFWDENVQPGKKYKYRVAVEYVNPVFGYKWGLQDKNLKTKGELKSDYSPEVEVKVHADVEFFVMNGIGGNREAASIRIFKNIGGKWYRNDISVPIGVKISGRVNKVDEGPLAMADVTTDHTVVDIQPISGNEVRVVLRDGEGRLSVRNSAADTRSPEMERLMSEVVRPVSASAETQPTAPAPGRSGTGRSNSPFPPGVTPTPGTAAPFRGGRGQ